MIHCRNQLYAIQLYTPEVEHGNLRIRAPWKRKIIFQTIIFRFYVKLGGCTYVRGVTHVGITNDPNLACYHCLGSKLISETLNRYYHPMCPKEFFVKQYEQVELAIWMVEIPRVFSWNRIARFFTDLRCRRLPLKTNSWKMNVLSLAIHLWYFSIFFLHFVELLGDGMGFWMAYFQRRKGYVSFRHSVGQRMISSS